MDVSLVGKCTPTIIVTKIITMPRQSLAIFRFDKFYCVGGSEPTYGLFACFIHAWPLTVSVDIK